METVMHEYLSDNNANHMSDLHDVDQESSDGEFGH